MIKTLMAVALAGAVALPMASALGDSPPGAAAPDTPAIGGTTAKQGRFEALDKNHDGFISRDEGKDAEELQTRFSELDTNNDNKLSRDEYNVLKQNARGAAGSTRSVSK